MRRQLMLAFAIFAVVVAVLFGMFAVAFTYAVEDTFFENALRDEAAPAQPPAASGQTAPPAGQRIYTDPRRSRLRERFLEYPSRLELPARRAPHQISSIAGEAAPAFLVAKSITQLVVRRLRRTRILAWRAGRAQPPDRDRTARRRTTAPLAR